MSYTIFKSKTQLKSEVFGAKNHFYMRKSASISCKLGCKVIQVGWQKHDNSQLTAWEYGAR